MILYIRAALSYMGSQIIICNVREDFWRSASCPQDLSFQHYFIFIQIRHAHSALEMISRCLEAHIQAKNIGDFFFRKTETHLLKESQRSSASLVWSETYLHLIKNKKRKRDYSSVTDCCLKTMLSFGKSFGFPFLTFYIKCFQETDETNWGIPGWLFNRRSRGHQLITIHTTSDQLDNKHFYQWNGAFHSCLKT